MLLFCSRNNPTVQVSTSFRAGTFRTRLTLSRRRDRSPATADINTAMFRNLQTQSRYLHLSRFSPSRTMAPIERITLFKIPNEADVQLVLEQYRVLAKTATKVRADCV